MFIGEIGINHNGSLDIAKKLIRVAQEAGVDVVKFQKRTPEICVPKERWDDVKETPWGQMTYIEYKKMMEFGKEEYDEIDKYCKEIGIKWTASVWDVPSLHFIMQYDVPFIKLASASLTDFELLKELAETYPDTHVILSTGGSTLKQIEEAHDYLAGYNITLMHCNSSYPSKDEELDLAGITLLKKMFGSCDCRIGYSGHEEGLMPTIMARTLGAEVIERHITLDKRMWGSDHKASLAPYELDALIHSLKRVDVILGKERIHVYPDEVKAMEKLRRVK